MKRFIILLRNKKIEILDASIHTCAVVASAVISIILSMQLEYMYIGKLFLIYITEIIIFYIIIRIILCSIFRPFIKVIKGMS